MLGLWMSLFKLVLSIKENKRKCGENVDGENVEKCIKMCGKCGHPLFKNYYY
jgi:hypothetical protein